MNALSSSFFFQAEDGIRDGTVTGVQTCALPILALILFFIERAPEDESITRLFNPHVMAGRHVLNPAFVGDLDQLPEFHPLIAAHAGIWGRPGGIAMKEIIDHRIAKHAALIDDLIGDAQALRHIPRYADLTASALLPFLRGGDVLVFMFPDLQRDTADVIAVAVQEGGG